MRGDQSIGFDELGAGADEKHDVSVERNDGAVGCSEPNGTWKRLDGGDEAGVGEELIGDHGAGGTSIRESLAFIGD